MYAYYVSTRVRNVVPMFARSSTLLLGVTPHSGMFALSELMLGVLHMQVYVYLSELLLGVTPHLACLHMSELLLGVSPRSGCLSAICTSELLLVNTVSLCDCFLGP